ncbi:protein far1-related sequence 11-like isoform x3 [Gigaspora margarita]|uniref:Protein far1-related sequence 11-like isoform x3 n=1 Tax=Gigaspora margarita TaxID=4874 RepID=A0A8H4EJE5_GIGMA|nr:protein far1-related sequence 11-like isoform x3 [Gigaspora margarita]
MTDQVVNCEVSTSYAVNAETSASHANNAEADTLCDNVINNEASLLMRIQLMRRMMLILFSKPIVNIMDLLLLKRELSNMMMALLSIDLLDMNLGKSTYPKKALILMSTIIDVQSKDVMAY